LSFVFVHLRWAAGRSWIESPTNVRASWIRTKRVEADAFR
jgi:hypothetical protein